MSWTDGFATFAKDVQHGASQAVGSIKATVSSGVKAAQHAAGSAALNFKGAAQRVAGGVVHTAQTGAKAVQALVQNGRRAARNAAKGVQQEVQHPGATAHGLISATARAAYGGVRTIGAATHAVQGGMQSAQHAAGSAVLNFKGAAERVAGGVLHTAQTGAKAAQALAQGGRRALRNTAHAAGAALHDSASRVQHAVQGGATTVVQMGGAVVLAVQGGIKSGQHAAGGALMDFQGAAKRVGGGLVHAAQTGEEAVKALAHNGRRAARNAAKGLQDAVQHPGQTADRMIDAAAGAAQGGIRSIGNAAHAVHRGVQCTVDETGRAIEAGTHGVKAGLDAVGQTVQRGIHDAGQAGEAVAGGVATVGQHVAHRGKQAVDSVARGIEHVTQTAEAELEHGAQAGVQHFGKGLIDAGHAVQDVGKPGGLGTLMQSGMRRLGEERDAAVRGTMQGIGRIVCAAGSDAVRAVRGGARALGEDASAVGKAVADSAPGQAVQTAGTLVFGSREQIQKRMLATALPGDFGKQLTDLPPGGKILVNHEHGLKGEGTFYKVLTAGGSGKRSRAVEVERAKDGTFNVKVIKSDQANATGSADVPKVVKVNAEVGGNVSSSTTMNYQTAAEAEQAARQAKVGMMAEEARDWATTLNPRLTIPMGQRQDGTKRPGLEISIPLGGALSPFGDVLRSAAGKLDNDAATKQDMARHVTAKSRSFGLNATLGAETPFTQLPGGIKIPAGLTAFADAKERRSEKLNLQFTETTQMGSGGKPSTVATEIAYNAGTKNRKTVGKKFGFEGGEAGVNGYCTSAPDRQQVKVTATNDISDRQAASYLREGGSRPQVNPFNPDALSVEASRTTMVTNPLGLAGGNLRAVQHTMGVRAEVKHPGRTGGRMFDDLMHGRAQGALDELGRNAEAKGYDRAANVTNPATTGFMLKGTAGIVKGEMQYGGSITTTVPAYSREWSTKAAPAARGTAPAPHGAAPSTHGALPAAHGTPSAAPASTRRATAEQDAWIEKLFGTKPP